MDRKAYLVALLALAVAGCNRSPLLSDDDDIGAIAHDEALDATAPKFSELEERIDELERQVSALEHRDDTLRDYIAATHEESRTADKRQDTWAETNHKRLFENDRTFANRLGMPFQENQ